MGEFLECKCSQADICPQGRIVSGNCRIPTTGARLVRANSLRLAAMADAMADGAAKVDTAPLTGEDNRQRVSVSTCDNQETLTAYVGTIAAVLDRVGFVVRKKALTDDHRRAQVIDALVALKPAIAPDKPRPDPSTVTMVDDPRTIVPPPQPAAPPLAVGDVVRLKGSDVRMTVDLPLHRDRFIMCVWFDHNSKLHRDRFPVDMLVVMKRA